MLTNLSIVLQFLEKCNQKISKTKSKGSPLRYSHSSMIIFFIHMMIKKVFTFQAMEKYAKEHFTDYGWQSSPCRKTIRLRFLSVPNILQSFMAQISKECDELDHRTFGFSWAFVDKSIFQAKWGIWHKTHIKLGIVPHKSIDPDASWGFSPYHKWRFGYGLHIIVNQNRFPITASVTTAKSKDYNQMTLLLTHIYSKIGLIVGDAGYLAVRIMQKIHQTYGILLYTHKTFVDTKTTFKRYYNDMVNTTQARLLYRKRKPSVERQRPTASFFYHKGNLSFGR
jgi:Transposase DDE domain